MKHLYFNPREGVVPVKQGFCWPACIFGSLWAMAHRMWMPYVLVLLPLECVFGLLAGLAYASQNPLLLVVMALANIGFAWVRGRYGNQWFATALMRRGYAQSDALLLQP